MNPGDRDHGLGSITKVAAGRTPAVVDLLTKVYGTVTGGNLFVAAENRTAEPAKVIENAQRDLNIAFVNEVAMIFDKMGLSTANVLAAARTKWNFLDFRPGLVGGHCIGVDPYYLALAAEAAGHSPEIILAGRRINGDMAGYVAGRVLAELAVATDEAPALVVGLTFKENVPDLRNSKVAALVKDMQAAGASVVVYDPLSDPAEVRRLFDIEPTSSLDGLPAFDAVVGAVAHDEFRVLSRETMRRLVKSDGLVVDIKGMWRHDVFPGGVRRWAL